MLISTREDLETMGVAFLGYAISGRKPGADARRKLADAVAASRGVCCDDVIAEAKAFGDSLAEPVRGLADAACEPPQPQPRLVS